MPELKLKFACGEASLSVRDFSVTEAVSGLFEVEVLARSRRHDIDLEQLVGKGASLRINSGKKHVGDGVRCWHGLCRHVEQLQAETAKGSLGESTYALSIVPELWLLTQRTNFRIFQHRNVPDIVRELLDPWRVSYRWDLDRDRYPKLPYRCQYGETDFAFFTRILQEAGIEFTFADEDEHVTKLVFADALHATKAKPVALHYVDAPNQASEQAFVTNVELDLAVRHGAYAIRDFDLRRPGFALVAEAPKAQAPESRYEVFDYEPGAFLVETQREEGTPAADVHGAARHDLDFGKAFVARQLEAERADRWRVELETNVVDLPPGTVFVMERHPHPRLSSDVKLLVTRFTIQGSPDGEWSSYGEATLASVPYRSRRTTLRPEVTGVQSATVVGPKGEEIFTDELGRVRVQFPWDREGTGNEHSSCWVRVSQGWAGTGFGLMTLPRVGQEVLVGFLEGNPDQPIIVGRVFNATQPSPYKLPEHRTRSVWRSNSSPGGGGYNELLFEDKRGEELLYLQAQKNLRKLVKNDETITVGRDRQWLVNRDDFETVKRHRTEVTGGDRTELTDGRRTTVVGGSRRLLVKRDARRQVEGNERVHVAGDQHVVIEEERRELVGGNSHHTVKGDRREQVTGTCSLVVGGDLHTRVGGRHALEVKQEIHLRAGDKLVIEADSEVTLKGPGGFVKCDASGVTIKGTLVFINSGSAQPGNGAGAQPSAALEAERITVETPERPEPDDVGTTGLKQ